MTRRERMEARLEKRREWAASRERDAARRFDTAHKIGESIPLGQPILVDHYSARRHCGDLARMDSNMSKGCESAKMAEHHAAKAGGIEAQLAESIYSDDPDAVEALEAKAAKLEAERDQRKAANAAYKRGGWDAVRPILGDERTASAMRTLALCPYNRVPFPPYSLQNIGATIRTARKRIEEVKRQAAERAKTEAAGGFRIARDYRGEWCAAQFSEKPAREVIDALKAAGFRWGAGRWVGRIADLPACVLALEAAPTPSPAPEGVRS